MTFFSHLFPPLFHGKTRPPLRGWQHAFCHLIQRYIKPLCAPEHRVVPMRQIPPSPGGRDKNVSKTVRALTQPDNSNSLERIYSFTYNLQMLTSATKGLSPVAGPLHPQPDIRRRCRQNSPQSNFFIIKILIFYLIQSLKSMVHIDIWLRISRIHRGFTLGCVL